MDPDIDLARIALQEELLRFQRFDANTAWALGLALKQAVDGCERGVAIDISTHAQLLFHHATAGATPRQR